MSVKPGVSDGENRGWWSFKMRVLRKMSGPKTRATEVCRKLHSEKFHNL
jgi:hypothetical protein